MLVIDPTPERAKIILDSVHASGAKAILARHTTASLLMMAGVNPGAVQRILRHSDPRITTETYGHLQPDYLRSEIDRLRFNTVPANDPSDLDPSVRARLKRDSAGLVAAVVQQGGGRGAA